MADYLNHLLFGIYPYIALSVLVIGSIIRFDREPYGWRSGSSQLLRRKQLVWGSVLFHLGVLVVLFGHIFGLLVPIWVFDSLHVKHEWKQALAVGAGGIAGAVSFVGASMLLHRRLFDQRVRANSSFSDTGILALLWLQLALGLATVPISLGHMDGAQMHGLGQWHLHLQSGGIFLYCRVALDFPDPYFSWADHLPAVPVHPAGPYALRSGSIPLALGLSDRPLPQDGDAQWMI